VTASSYSRCVAAGGCTSPACDAAGSSSPASSSRVTCVDFAQASAYCAFVGGRLPTEEEWEHAARESRALGMRDTDDAAEWTSSPYCYFCGRNDEVVRGGPARNPGLRGWRSPDAHERDVGFRCARDDAQAPVTR
jgi:formylglycine-generating enzyme required for sulfatase activity